MYQQFSCLIKQVYWIQKGVEKSVLAGNTVPAVSLRRILPVSCLGGKDHQGVGSITSHRAKLVLSASAGAISFNCEGVGGKEPNFRSLPNNERPHWTFNFKECMGDELGLGL